MANNISEVIRMIAQRDMPYIAVGYISSVSPLQVVLMDDMNVSLSEQSVIIPSRSRRHICEGDKWYLLVVNRGKIYYFLDRV